MNLPFDAVALIRHCKMVAKINLAVLDPTGRLGDMLQDVPVTVSAHAVAVNRAGFFSWHGNLGRIWVNGAACQTAARFEMVLFHELAHAACHYLYGVERVGHGEKWQNVMRLLDQEPVVNLEE